MNESEIGFISTTMILSGILQIILFLEIWGMMADLGTFDNPKERYCLQTCIKTSQRTLIE
jgi:hypothetical protein